ncbi:hypothetical protein CSV71_08070 [Sporosarcina sp. P21c]|uniref:hypothetical protein n=1 Tax=unclassified Sporosarcina TaxID=2647733 RepID=UPI000C169A71|nr:MULTISPECIES: hypothetical protein [unclassified Sporosarcina]PIC66760.1 hypothetical protein CSV78_11290 [Sporosarcina sp. P16a]PIC89895.1 hypothetical protein CSV71_08070 [Sporosarcina sp. P21c]PIC93281.1 hypothetical protein CSV70_06885 [Sporosarcina sp. P25]
MNELFTSANNGKVDIASDIGSPAPTDDTFAQLKTHTQNSKNKDAENLTTKGTPAIGTETLDSLMSKIANVYTGKKYVVGSGSYTSDGTITVTGLSFRPRFF